MINLQVAFFTALVIGLVVWGVLQSRHNSRTNKPLPIYNFDPNQPNHAFFGRIVLPAAGTLHGTFFAVPTKSNVLVFRSQMKTPFPGPVPVPFRFPLNATDLTKTTAINNFFGRQGEQTLYSFETASALRLPWPPCASAQLITYYADPHKSPSPNNKFQSGMNQKPSTNPRPFESNLDDQFVLNYPGNGGPNQLPTFVKVAGISNEQGDAQNTVLGTSTQLNAVSLQFQDTGVVYIEMAGGRGGSYLAGVGKNAIRFEGGAPGIVWAYVAVKPGDVWQVQLSQDGASLTPLEVNENLNPTNSSISGGGLGSFLAGSEGGGCTQLSERYPGTPNGPLTGKSAGSITMLAGGGGGASRNAFGGSAGCSLPRGYETTNFQNRSHPYPFLTAFPGGPTNAINEDDIPKSQNQKQSNQRQFLSGGGASSTKVGEGYSVAQLASQGISNGSVVGLTAGKNLEGGFGSQNPPGGGGGGAGFRGGASGTWNGVNAPNNEHGAGGGGSSLATYVTSSMNPNVLNRNPQQYPEWPSQFSNQSPEPNPRQHSLAASATSTATYVFEPTNQFLIGLPTTSTTQSQNTTISRNVQVTAQTSLRAPPTTFASNPRAALQRPFRNPNLNL